MRSRNLTPQEHQLANCDGHNVKRRGSWLGIILRLAIRKEEKSGQVVADDMLHD